MGGWNGVGWDGAKRFLVLSGRYFSAQAKQSKPKQKIITLRYSVGTSRHLFVCVVFRIRRNETQNHCKFIIVMSLELDTC